MNYRLDEQAAPRIKMERVACHCDNPTCEGKHLDPEIRPRTQRMLNLAGELIREYELCYDHAWRVTSCQRCPAHNAKVGGSPNSAHIHNCAIDIWVAGPVVDLMLLAEQQGCWSSIIANITKDDGSGVLHLDLHPDDQIRRGHKDSAGSYRVKVLGTRFDTPLLPVMEWNIDEDGEEVPAYINAHYQRTTPDGL